MQYVYIKAINISTKKGRKRKLKQESKYTQTHDSSLHSSIENKKERKKDNIAVRVQSVEKYKDSREDTKKRKRCLSCIQVFIYLYM